MLTYYQSNRLINFNFGNTSYIVPDNFYIGLSSQDPGAEGINALEPAGGGYARVQYGIGTSYWTESTLGILENSNDISFPKTTSTWGNITHIFLADSSIKGNILYYDTLPFSVHVESDSIIKLLAGDIKFTLLVTS